MKKLTRIVSMILCIALALSLCACGGTEKKSGLVADDESKHEKITWLIRSSQPEGFDEVLAAANEYLGEKLNITLDLQCVEPGDYASKLQLAFSSDEDVDIIWTSDWAGDYEGNSVKGGFLALDEYLELPELADLKNYYKDGIWEATTIGGKIYGVPMEQVFHVQRGYWYMKDVANKYGLEQRIRDLAWVDENTHGSMDELEEIFDIVREGEDKANYHISTGGFSTFEPTYSQVAGYNVIDGKVTYDYDKAVEDALRYRRWNEKGYFPGDVATNDNLDGLTKLGKVFTRYSRHLPGVEAKHLLSSDFEVIAIPTSEMVINRTGIQSTLNAIAANCENPVRALKLLYLMHTDEYIMNLLSYGLEGRDFTKIPDTDPQRIERNAGGFYISEFMIGSQFLCWLAPAYDDDVWEQTKHENDTARIDEYIGFSFDPSPVESEMSTVSAVNAEYSKIITCGLSENPVAVMEEKEEKMKKAGRQVIMDEAQKQLDEWLAENK